MVIETAVAIARPKICAASDERCAPGRYLRYGCDCVDVGVLPVPDLRGSTGAAPQA